MNRSSSSESEMFQKIRSHWKKSRADAHREYDIKKSKDAFDPSLSILREIISEYHCLLNKYKVETHAS